MVKTFHYDSKEETAEQFAQRVADSLYPEGEKYCMFDCKFCTGYSDGSGAYCNNPLSPYSGERTRSWDAVGDCPCFEEGKRIKNRDEEAQDDS